MKLPSYRSFRRKNDHTLPGVSLGVTVQGGNVERALKILKRKVKDAGTLFHVKDNRYFTKKSHTKRVKKQHAVLIQKRISKQDRDSKLF